MHMHVSHSHSMNTGSSSPQWFTTLTMTSSWHHFDSVRHWNSLNRGLILWAQQCEGVHIRLWTNSKTWPYTSYSYVSMIDQQCLNEPYVVSKATKAIFSVDMSFFFSSWPWLCDMMKEDRGLDHLAIAWQYYPGKVLKIITKLASSLMLAAANFCASAGAKIINMSTVSHTCTIRLVNAHLTCWTPRAVVTVTVCSGNDVAWLSTRNVQVDITNPGVDVICTCS